MTAMASHRTATYLLAGVIILVAGCGSSASKTPSRQATATTAPAGAVQPSPLDAWLVKGNEEPGYAGSGTTANVTVAQFVAPEPANVAAVDAAQLKRNGFRGAAVENLNPTSVSNNGAAVSLVIELASSAAARRQQAVQLRIAISSQGAGTVIKHFTVAGVPGAQGFTGTAPQRGAGAANVVFAEGSCVLLIGDFNPVGNLIAPVKHAAAAVYQRTHGACP
jgi:hypothetical protein